MSKKKICFIAQFPPPMHGLSKAVETLYSSNLNSKIDLHGEFEFEKVDITNNKNFIKNLLKISRSKADLFYFTISQTKGGNLRDLVIFKLLELQHKETDEVKRIPFDKKWYYVTRPGSTYCFRKTFFEEIENEWNINAAHDCNLWYFATAQGKMAIYHHITMKFRRHGDNASTEHLNTVFKRYETAKMAKDVNAYFEGKVSGDKKEVVQEIIAFCEARMKFLTGGKLSEWIKLFLLYRSYYLTVKGCVADLACMMKEKLI